MQHLAIIPDGNRRWAAQNKLESFFGHQKGMETVRSAIKVCIKNEIAYLSFYTFSIENFRRSDIEKRYLFNLLTEGFTKELPELIDAGIRVRFVGDRAMFPEQIRDTIEIIEKQTAHLNRLTLNLLFCYGAKSEIAHAVKKIAQDVKEGRVQIDDINDTIVDNALWTAGIPNPDLIIRTGGVVRLSNFLLLQAAYSEFLFLDYYWPDMTEERLEQCLEQFKQTQRNFGQ